MKTIRRAVALQLTPVEGGVSVVSDGQPLATVKDGAGLMRRVDRVLEGARIQRGAFRLSGSTMVADGAVYGAA